MIWFEDGHWHRFDPKTGELTEFPAPLSDGTIPSYPSFQQIIRTHLIAIASKRGKDQGLQYVRCHDVLENFGGRVDNNIHPAFL